MLNSSAVKKQENSFNFNQWLVDNALIVIIVSMVIYTSFATDNFLSFINLKNILQNVAIRYVIALGVSGCLIIGGTDLSAGRIVGITAVVTGMMQQRPDAANVLFPGLAGSNFFITMIVAMLVGLIFGSINGLIISKLHVPAFIATLGTQVGIYGLNQTLSQNQPIGSLQDSLVRFGVGGLDIGPLNIPWIFFASIIAGIVMYKLYNDTKYGKYMYALGGNELAATVSGINTNKTKFLIFTLAGALYGLAGFMLTATTGSASVSAGTGYELEAIAAATIGGVSTTGGVGSVGSVGGVFIGVLIFELLKVCLQFLGASPEMTLVIQGIVIVAAVALDIRKIKTN